MSVIEICRVQGALGPLRYIRPHQIQEHGMPACRYAMGMVKPNYPMPAIPFECLLYDEFVAIWRKRDDAIHHECDVMIYKQY